jgi:hypothetical protein
MPTVWEVVFAVPLLLATLASASLIALTKSDDAPSSKEDGYEGQSLCSVRSVSKSQV